MPCQQHYIRGDYKLGLRLFLKDTVTRLSVVPSPGYNQPSSDWWHNGHIVRMCDEEKVGYCCVFTIMIINTKHNISLSAGDVSPISMSPISQSQFIPLGEVLLLAISAMNSAHKPVTQEALTEHLQTCFPGNDTKSRKMFSAACSSVPKRNWYATTCFKP